MIQKFDGVNLYSKNPLRCKRFYHDLLGIPVLSDDLRDFDGAQFRFGENLSLIHISMTRARLLYVDSCPTSVATVNHGQNELAVRVPAMAPWSACIVLAEEA